MMLERVMHAPINLYFDITPVSRIMKHFTDDIAAFDLQFMFAIHHVIGHTQVMAYSALYIL